MMSKTNHKNSNSDFADKLNKATQGRDVISNNCPQFVEKKSWRDLRKEKYLDDFNLDPNKNEFEMTQDYMKYLVDILGDALYNIDVKSLKNLDKIKMKNGVYKAIVKDVDQNGTIVSVAKANIKNEDTWETKIETLDYFVPKNKVNWVYGRWDQLFVNINLNKGKNKLSVEEFSLNQWEICLVIVTNVSDKWTFIRVGKYEWFISKKQLKESGCGYEMKKWEPMYVKIKKILDNKKKWKKWLIWDVVEKPSKEVKIVSLDTIKNADISITNAA